MCFTVLDEFQVAGGGSYVAFAELVMNHHTPFGQVPNHGHIALFALVGKVGSFFLGDDLAGINIQRRGGNAGLPDPRGDDPAG
jgi:hypothetical protein